MSKQEAHMILDAARAGVPTAMYLMTQALVVTGDLMHRVFTSSTAEPSQHELLTATHSVY